MRQKLIKKSEPKIEESTAERTKLRRQKYKECFENIESKSNAINNNLLKKCFKFESPVYLTKQLYKIKNKNKNNELVSVIKSRIIYLKN